MDLLNKTKAKKKQNLNRQYAEELFNFISEKLNDYHLSHGDDVSLYTIEVNLVLNLLNAHIQSVNYVNEQVADPEVFDRDAVIKKMQRNLDIILKQVGLVTQSIEKEG